MIHYVEEEQVCRSRMLLIHFGEKDAKDCGRCDYCLKKRESGLTNYQYGMLREKICRLLRDETSCRLNDLVDRIADEEADEDKVIRVIRFMVDSEELSLKDDRIGLN